MKNKTLFGQRLRFLREQQGLTQPELAQRLDTVKQNISRYELNLAEPEYSILIQIADYFDVTVDYLLGRTDNPK